MDIRGKAVEDQIRIEDMATSIVETMRYEPNQLKATAGGSKCSIFRIPRNLEAINPQAYHPRIISIGPYHHGKPELSMMEEHKWRFLKVLLARSEQHNGLLLQDYLAAMAELEDSARACYSEEIVTMDSRQFVRMLLLDGCFLVELFRLYDLGGVELENKEDPIFYIPWLISFLTRDLLRLENQLPFFVLQHLFDLSYVPNGKPKSSFPLLAIKFFSWVVPRPDEAIEWSTQKERSHLLDLFRATFIPPNLENGGEYSGRFRWLPCATKLFRAGIYLTPLYRDNTYFLDTKFERRVLKIPQLVIDEFAISFLQNCIAFEQSHQHCGNCFTTFAIFMDCLINTGEDVSLLGDAKVIQNNFGTDDDVADFFKKLGREMVFDEENCYLANDLNAVHKYYHTSVHARWEEFKRTHMSAPWFLISAMAASILLILTVVQTFYTIYPYYHPNN